MVFVYAFTSMCVMFLSGYICCEVTFAGIQSEHGLPWHMYFEDTSWTRSQVCSSWFTFVLMPWTWTIQWIWLCTTMQWISCPVQLWSPSWVDGNFHPSILQCWLMGFKGQCVDWLHPRARKTPFVPNGTKDRPVSVEDLASRRVTEMELADGT